MQTSKWIWTDGEWVPWEEATVHVTTHALHYGSSIFEGIRAYAPPSGPALFRLHDHMRRFLDSAKLMRMVLPYTTDDLESAACELVARNHDGACYVRPLAFRAAGALGVDGRKLPVSTVMLSFEWGVYLGEGALENGIDAAVSSWRRFSGNALMPRGKIGGQYVNSQLVSAQAHLDGYQEGIVLDEHGLVAEGAGENLFVVVDGALLTPPLSTSILAGITRDSVCTLARDLGIEVRETAIGRDLLYLADELFMTGTAAEITPVRSVDQIVIGDGRPGPLTRKIQDAFFTLLRGESPDPHGWLTDVRTFAVA